MQEELERGQTFQAPVVNILHETAEAARVNSTYVQARLAGEPRIGPPTNKTAEVDLDVSLTGLAGNSSSYHAGSTVASTGDGADASVMFKPSAGGGFNASTFGANSGIKPLPGQALPDSSTALPTALSTAEGNPATSSAIDPLASLLGESEFSLGGLGVGYHSATSATSMPPSGNIDVSSGFPKKNPTTSNYPSGNYNSNHNYSIDEEKSYNNTSSSLNKSGQQPPAGGFDSYLGSSDNR